MLSSISIYIYIYTDFCLRGVSINSSKTSHGGIKAGKIKQPSTRNPRITYVALRVQVFNYHILSKNSNLHNYFPKPEYLIIGSFGPLGLTQKTPFTCKLPGWTSRTTDWGP